MLQKYFSKNRKLPYKILSIFPNFIYENLLKEIMDVGRNFRTINSHIKKNNITLVLDVGANMGHYSEGIRMFGYEKKIVAFEPINRLYVLLDEKFENDKKVKVYNLALGNEKKELEINIASNNGSSSSILKPKLVKKEFKNISFNKKETIKIQKLDNIINEFSNSKDNIYLKLDVQGFEKNVIEGSLKTLNRIKIIQLETSTIQLYEGENTIDEIISYMYKKKFVLIDIIGSLKNNKGQLIQTDLIFLNKK